MYASFEKSPAAVFSITVAIDRGMSLAIEVRNRSE